MVEVADEYKLTDETLFLAINFVDRFLSVMSISRQSFQLLGTAALFISAKYEEIYPPDVHEFVSITDDTYTKTQVLNMEKLILKVLQFDVSAPTAHYFLRKYLSHLQLPKHINHLAEYLCYLTLLEDFPFLRYLPSEIAICSIILAVHTYGIRGVDFNFYKNTLLAIESNEPKNLERLITSRQTCIEAMHKMQIFASQHSQQAIFHKFCGDKFAGVALRTAAEKSPDFKIYFT
ncbi:cyclin-A2-like protein [Leptotrombidium deliense]|uniref:Cyclin-A2-like protein n=1 Tax=Leptotrombidium deliense TaxID=299467 RepID=A0A443S201_9ACAR|nr:cyclin-A2-like protein [Leptotrombidium deliense]